MQPLTSALYNMLAASNDARDLLDLVEIYEPDEVDFVASNALYRFATEHITWGGQTYLRELVSRGTITRFYGGEFNEVSYTFSNIRRALGALFYTTEVEGYVLLHRIVSRRLDDGASFVVPFVGRCQKSVSVNKRTATLKARQYLGNIDTEIPPRVASHRCPLAFKETGGDCLGDQALAAKSGAYQAATTCDKSYDQCFAYGNEKYFQGFRYQSANGTFKFKANRGGAGGAFLSLLGLGKKKILKGWSSQEGSIVGQGIPLILGRAQMEGIPMSHADTGTAVAWVVAWCEGKVNAILNVRATTPGYDTNQTMVHHLGEYGGVGSQVITGAFAGTPIDYNSKLAFSTGVSINPSTPDSNDPVPEVSGLILGVEMTTPTLAGDYTDAGFSDNPADIARFVICENKLLNHPPELWNPFSAYKIWQECNEPLIDVSKAEQILFSTDSVGAAGVTWKLYRTSSIFDVYWLKFLLGLSSDHPSIREIAYTTYNPASPPSSTAATRYLRKRYTCNIGIVKEEKAVDFLFKTVFPTARLYMVTGVDGKLELRREKPSVSTLLRDVVAAGSSLIPIEDVYAWKNYYKPLVLVGVGLTTSEVHRAMSVYHSLAGNAITLTASGSGATALAASAALLSGATNDTPATATLTISGSAANGNILTATIDGVACTYTLTAADTLATALGMLAANINADTTLNRYVQAIWSGFPDVRSVRWENENYFLAAGATATAQVDTDPDVSGNPNGTTCARVQSADEITEDSQSFAFQVQNQGTASTASLDALIIVGLTDEDNPTPTAQTDGSQTWSTYEEPEYQFYFALGTGDVPVAYARTFTGGLLTGELEYTSCSVFRITRISSTVIKWYIDGVEVASLTTTVPATLRLAAVSGTRVAPNYLQPRILNAHFYDATTGNDNIIKLRSKLGWIQTETPLTNAHALAEEAIYIAMLFSDRAQDVNTRSNIVKDSAEFPLGERQSSINRVKLTYTDPLNDFHTVELRVNDYDHQTTTRAKKTIEISAQGIDNYHQAERLANNLLAKLRQGDFFVSWESGPTALPVEEGDVVAISTDLGGDGAERIFNLPLRIEEARIAESPFTVGLVGRKYATSMYSDDVSVRTVPLISGANA